MAGGHHALYSLDVYDAIAIFYLEKNQNKDLVTKEDVSLILRDIYSVNERLKKSISDGRFIYKERVRINVNNMIDSFQKNSLEMKTHSTIRLTDYIKNSLFTENGGSHSFCDHVDEYIEYLGSIHYGIQEKIMAYVQTPEYYKKNLRRWKGSFLAEGDGDDIKDLYVKYSENGNWIVETEEQLSHPSSMSILLNAVESIFSMTFNDYGNTEIDYKKRIGERSSFGRIINGRKENGYHYEHPSKITLLRCMITLGREDEIGSMMVRAGYWDKDWIYERNAEKCPYLNWTDWIIIFFIRYRDYLLNKWAEQAGKDQRTYTNTNRRVFPFAYMVAYITEDILYNISTMDYEKTIQGKIRGYMLKKQTNKKRSGSKDD